MERSGGNWRLSEMRITRRPHTLRDGTDECGAAAAGMHTELVGPGLSQAGVDRATDWAAPEKPQHECLLLMALYERFAGAFLDVEKAEWQAPLPKAAPPARTESTVPTAEQVSAWGQASAQGAPDAVSKQIEELEAQLSQLRAPKIPVHAGTNQADGG